MGPSEWIMYTIPTIHALAVYICLPLVIYLWFQWSTSKTEQQHTSISAEKRFSTYWSTPIITPCRCSGIESEPTQKTLHSAQHSISTLYYSQSICHWRCEQRGVVVRVLYLLDFIIEKLFFLSLDKSPLRKFCYIMFNCMNCCFFFL